MKGMKIMYFVYVIKFHAIFESNIFRLLYINIISKLDDFINEGVR
jgi:hypothetical protein